MNLKSNILLGMNVIVAMIKMKITTDSIHCTVTQTDLRQCSRIMNFKSYILICSKAILVMVITEITTDNIHRTGIGRIFSIFCLKKN